MPEEVSHSVAHYLMTIHKLRELKGYARVTDVARELKVTKGSVSTALTALKKRGLICEEQDSKFLLLTEPGHQLVHNLLANRHLLYCFFKNVLGVNAEEAFAQSCAMEHILHRNSQQQLFKFLSYLQQQNFTWSDGIIQELDIDFTIYGSLNEFVAQQDAFPSFEKELE